MTLQKIGLVSREIGISEQGIRRYEQAGLIRPRREPRTGDRLFDECDIEQLRIIRHLIQSKGFSIVAIRELIRYAPCWELTNCPHRDTCPIPRSSTIPCYEQRDAGCTSSSNDDCTRCIIYHSKKLSRNRIAVRRSPTADND